MQYLNYNFRAPQKTNEDTNTYIRNYHNYTGRLTRNEYKYEKSAISEKRQVSTQYSNSWVRQVYKPLTEMSCNQPYTKSMINSPTFCNPDVRPISSIAWYKYDPVSSLKTCEIKSSSETRKPYNCELEFNSPAGYIHEPKIKNVLNFKIKKELNRGE